MSSDQMPAPGKTKSIKLLPPGQEKTSNARDKETQSEKKYEETV